MSDLRTLLFDFGNVIIDIDVPGTKLRLESFLRADIPQEDAIHLLTPLVHAYETGKMDTDTFVHRLLQLASPEITSRDIIDTWNSMLLGIPTHRLVMLERLKEKYTVLMLSNINPLHVNWIHAYMAEVHGELKFEARYFHRVYFSHEIGFRKPQESAFQFVARDAAITPSQALFIDDMAENIHAAERVGFQTYHIVPGEEISEVLKAKGLY